MRVTDPKPNESLSEYTDRILGVPGSSMRRLGGNASYEDYEMVWKAFQSAVKTTNTKERNDV